MPRHIISANQFRRDDIIRVFEAAADMERRLERGIIAPRSGKLMAALFYEASTRTRFSFEAGMLRLGGDVVSTENAREYSSAYKGETLEDTIHTAAAYADVIVLRHFETGAAERVARVSPVPVINGGDGMGEHPTQALLDLYTISKELGGVDGKIIACVGDLAHGRTVRSLVMLSSEFTVKKFIFVAPEQVRMRDDIKSFLAARVIPYDETTSLEDAVTEADVVYMTRIQKERFSFWERLWVYRKIRDRYIIDRRIMDLMNPKGILMHPLPRKGEIKTEVDADPRAAYFRQVKNGLFVRMALLEHVLSA